MWRWHGLLVRSPKGTRRRYRGVRRTAANRRAQQWVGLGLGLILPAKANPNSDPNPNPHPNPGSFFDAAYTQILPAEGASLFAHPTGHNSSCASTVEAVSSQATPSQGKEQATHGGALAHRTLLLIWPNNPDHDDNTHLLQPSPVQPSLVQSSPAQASQVKSSTPPDHAPLQPVWDAACLQVCLGLA